MLTLGRSLALMSLLALGCVSLRAQTTVELLTTAGESSWTGSGTIFNTYWHDCRNESLYLASEMTAAGIPANAVIQSIQFKCSESNAKALEQMRIRVQQTTNTTVTGYTATGWTTCYGPTTFSGTVAAGAWYTFTFASTFQWNGTSNLLIDYTEDGTSWTSGGGMYMRTTTASRNAYGYSDSGYTWPFDAMLTSTRNAVPSLKITYTGGTPPPTIVVTSSATPLQLGSTPAGTAGTPSSYTVSGTNLTANIVVTAPSTSVQVSLTSGSGYAASVSLTPSGGTVGTTTIYARISTAAPVGSVSGNITHTSTGATTQNLAVNGTVTTPVPSISVTSSANPLGLGSTIVGNAGTPASYTVSGANLTADIVITAPSTSVELCLTSGGTYTATLNLTPSGGTVATTTIYARISTTAPLGAVSGNITHTSTGATQQDLPVTGTVTVPPPAIALSGVTPPLNLGSTFQGTAGNPAQYMVTGTNLTADIVITAPTGVELSQTGATGAYATTQTLTQTGGAASGTIHARIASTAAIGAVSGNITHVSTSATTNLAVTGTVNPTAPDMSVTRGVTAVADGGTDALANRAFGAPFSLTYTVANSGTAALSLNGAPPVVAAPVANCTVSVTAQPTPTSVAIAGSVTFTVSCTPTAAGAFSFTLSIANNDPVANRNPYNWTGSGTGVTAPLMTLTRGAAIANGGTDAVGSVSTTIPLTLNYTVGNSGTAVLNLNGTPKVTVSGLTNCAVSVTTQPGATVAIAGTTSFVLNVRALGNGALSFSVSIANDDPNQAPYTFTGNGSGAGGLGSGLAGGGGGGGGACSVDSSGSTMVWFALLALFAALSLAARRAKA